MGSEGLSEILTDLLSLPDDEIRVQLDDFSDSELNSLVYDWGIWARKNQLIPPGDWSTWLVLAGRGFGKTRMGAETIRAWACGSTPLSRGTYGRFALVAETAADARDVLVEGESGILGCHPKDFRPLYEPSKRRLTWPNGAMATIYNATEPDQLRGPQHEAAWCDELAKWAYARETWEQLEFGLRLGPHPRSIITTTPRPIPVLREILKSPDTHVTKGRTMDNSANLSRKFIDKIHAKFSGTRLGRQELEAEMLEDLPGALWTRDMFDPPDGSPFLGRVEFRETPELERVVVAVDPSGIGKADEGGDSIGIVVAGLGEDGRGYILADRSMRGGPAEWGREVVRAYSDFSADRVVAEVNYGGAMVEHVLRTVDKLLPVTLVHASRGKHIRAEPVAALYEQGRVSHVTGADLRDTDHIGFSVLEDQMCLVGPKGYEGEGSPDRMDAAVWAITELMLKDEAEGWILTR